MAALHSSVLVGAPNVERRMRAYHRYLQDLFLRPVEHGALASLVYERQGEIRGFLGIVPRTMRFNSQPLVAAVCSQFVVHPSERGVAGLQMLKACFAGPQDVSLADEANDNTRKMWEWCGGAALLPYSIHWVRPLRPARAMLALAQHHTQSQWVRMLHPAATIADAVCTAFRPNVAEADGSREPLHESAIAAFFGAFAGSRAVVPAYDTASVTWLFERLRLQRGRDGVRQQLVRDESRQAIGWFVYAIADDGVADVLQVVARPGAARAVIAHLVEDATTLGAVALSGRLDPALTPELSERHNLLYRRGHWALAFAKNVELMHALQRGDAFLSRLEGEACLRFTS